MKSIHYVGDTLVTGDAIADAIVHYAEALARKETSAAVDVPIRLPDGSIEQASLLLGPASQIVAVHDESGFEEIVDEELVARLRRASAALGDTRAVPEASNQSDSGVLDDLDLA